MEGLKSVSVEKFQTYVVTMSTDMKDIDRRIHGALKFPEVFNQLRVITDPPNLEDNSTLRIVLDSYRRQASIDFVKKLFPESSLDLIQRDVTEFKTLRNIGKGEDLYIDLGSLYYLISHLPEVILDLEK